MEGTFYVLTEMVNGEWNTENDLISHPGTVLCAVLVFRSYFTMGVTEVSK